MTGRCAAPGPPLRGPVSALWALPCPGPSECRPWPIGRDSMTFLIKLVKTAKCHQNVSKRPPLVPIFQNGSQKSPLEILRFPYSAAFSPKELMGHFRPYPGHYCQNDEVSTVCTPWFSTRNGRRYPHGHPAASCSWGDRSSSAQRGILNAPGFKRFAPDYD